VLISRELLITMSSANDIAVVTASLFVLFAHLAFTATATTGYVYAGVLAVKYLLQQSFKRNHFQHVTASVGERL